MKRARVLFLTEGKEGEQESPAATFRIWQLLPFLEAEGIDAEVAPSTPNKYRSGDPSWPQLARGASFGPWNAVRIANRLKDIRKLSKFDVIVLQRELLNVGPPWLESEIVRRHPRVVFDFDDAIFLPPPAPYSFLVPTDKVVSILRSVKEVWAGNKFLADFASAQNDNVAVIPTPVNHSRFRARSDKENHPPVIGWIGQPVNYKEVEAIAPALTRLARDTQFRLYVITRGRPGPAPDGVDTEFVEWDFETETAGIRGFDIGIMPLTDTVWNRGKCALKALQCMATGIPVVVSPVGANQEAVQNGAGGIFAATEEEWANALGRLVRDAEFRKDLGCRARKRIEEAYSCEIVAKMMAERIRALAVSPQSKRITCSPDSVSSRT